MEPLRSNRSRLAAAAVLGLVAALAAGCADPDAENEGTAGQDGGGAPATIEIVEPADGATVTVPFEVAVTSSLELGPIDQGLHHFHVWFGDAADQPLIVESDSVSVENAPSGMQTMWVSLQEADHTPVGNPVSISIMIEGGSEQGPELPPDY